MRQHWIVALGFLAVIALGAVFLACPFAQAGGARGDVLDSVFTACSAVCVTGLSVVDIAETYSRAGQIGLLVLVELGCLGLMTWGSFLMILVGQRLSLRREVSLMTAYGVKRMTVVRAITCWVVPGVLAFEALGTLAYYALLGDWYEAIFYSIMSFCNAGFSIRPGSLATFADNSCLVLVSALLTIVGGLGFLVIYNLATFMFLRRDSGGRGRLSLQTSVVLRFTLYLLVFAFVAFLLLEWNGALAGFTVSKKLWVGFYQAVTPRTCGFSITPTESLKPLTQLVYEFLMFIGGGPGSAAAGIKVTTFAVLCYTLTAMCRGETETVIARKLVSTAIVRESLVILMALILIAAVFTGALFQTELEHVRTGAVRLNELFFEAVSAITTTGLSVGETTRHLTFGGRIVIMIAMFVGRLGALTVVMMIGDRESNKHVRYPSEEIVVG